MNILKRKGMSWLCFVTPTEGWAERMDNALGVPSPWPVMLVELLVGEDGRFCRKLFPSHKGLYKIDIKAYPILHKPKILRQNRL